MSYDDYGWLTNYWPQTRFVPAPGSFQDAQGRPQPQMQHPGQRVHAQDGPMTLDPAIQDQPQPQPRPPLPAPPARPEQYAQHQWYPYISPYGPYMSLASQAMMLSLRFAPPAYPMNHPPTTMAPRPPATMTAPPSRPSSVVPAPPPPAPPASHSPPQQKPIHPQPLFPPAKPPTPADPTHDPKRRRLDDGHAEPIAQKPSAPPTVPPPPRNLSSYSYTPRDPKDKNYLRARADLIQILKEEDAAEKIIYDPNTIARDILIAAGRHPTEPALNHHLFRLRDVFTQVDMMSDLDTFRWDIVDSPTMQVQPEKEVTASKPPSQHPKPPKPLKQSPTLPPSQPSQPIHPDGHLQQPPANQHLPSFVPRDQHQPIIASPRPTPESRSQPAVSFPVPQPPPQQQHQQKQPQPQQPRPQTTPETNGYTVAVQLPAQSPHPVQPQQQQKTSPQKQSTPVQSSEPPHTPCPRGRRPKTPKTQQDKMVGTKAMPRVEVSIPVSAPMSYPVYPCEWRNCQAELHNLEMLKFHLLKLHIPHTITCNWSGCKCEKKMAAAELFNHVKSQHLDPIAWRQGDGPSVPRSVDNEAGKGPNKALATPEPRQPGGDSLIFPASYSSIRAFNRVHGNTSQKAKAQEILKAVQRLKERIGVGLDPGGCQLATPARNERVSNDEEVYELCSDSEPDGGGFESESPNDTLRMIPSE